MVLLSNPKKKRAKRRARRAAASSAAPKRRVRRRARRNPSLSLPRVNLGGVDVMQVGIGIAGGLGTVMAVNAAAPMLPVQFQTGWGKLGAKVAVIGIAAMLLPRFVGRGAARDIVTGAAVVVGVDAVREFLAPHVKGLSGLTDSPFMLQSDLSGYLQPGPNAMLLSPRAPAWSNAA